MTCVSFPLRDFSPKFGCTNERKVFPYIPHVFSNVFGFDVFLNLFLADKNFNKFRLHVPLHDPTLDSLLPAYVWGARTAIA